MDKETVKKTTATQAHHETLTKGGKNEGRQKLAKLSRKGKIQRKPKSCNPTWTPYQPDVFEYIPKKKTLQSEINSNGSTPKIFSKKQESTFSTGEIKSEGKKQKMKDNYIKKNKFKKITEKDKKNIDYSSIGYFQFKFLNQQKRLEAILILPKVKLKDFYAQEYIEKLLNRLNTDVVNKKKFLETYKLPLFYNKPKKIFSFNKKFLKKLFDNPKFFLVCRELNIDPLTAKKVLKRKGANKLTLIINKLKINEGSLGQVTYEKNLRFNKPDFGSRL